MVLLLASLAFAPNFTIEGTCPGVLDIEFSNLPDDGTVYVMAGDGPGESAIPVGPCAGESSGVSGRVRPIGMLRDDDGDGMISFSPDVPEVACDFYMVASQATDCTSSPAAPVGGSTCDDVCARARAAGCDVMEDCESDCETDLDVCPSQMESVVECHLSHAIMCDDVEDQGIGRAGCERAHVAAEDCGIDPF